MGKFLRIPSWMNDNLISALIILLISSIYPTGMDKTGLVIIAGIILIIAFIELAENNDRGVPTKLVYTIGRYGIATMLFIVMGVQLYLYFTEPTVIHLSIYSLVVYGALIAYLVAFKPSKTTFGKKILKIIGYTLVFVAINALQKVRIETFSNYGSYGRPYLFEGIDWGMLVFLCIIMITGVICIKVGCKTTEVHAPDDINIVQSAIRFYTSSQDLMKNKTDKMVSTSDSKHKKYRSKQIILNIILSIALIISIGSSLSFMEQGDGLTVCGFVFYIPICGIIVAYYLWLIWSREKVTGAKMLLLPLLQKTNLFKWYKDDLNGKQELAKTVLPFLLSIFICPMLTSILYTTVYRHKYSQQEWLIIILLLPPLILVIGLAKSFVKHWVNQSSGNEAN